MREQRGLTSAQTVPRQRENHPVSYTGHHAGIHPDDVPCQTDEYQIRHTKRTMFPDEWVEPPRRGTSVKPATPKSIIRVTTHEVRVPMQRASQMQPQTRPHPPVVTQARKRKRRLHWMVYVGGVLCIALVGGMLLNMVMHWAQVTWDDVHYGRPRTYQTDADVGHGGISHFTVENLGGQIFVIEIPMSDPKKYKLYGLELTGTEASLAVATITFQDVTGDGKPDMIITVNYTTTYVFTNTPDGFTPRNTQARMLRQGGAT